MQKVLNPAKKKDFFKNPFKPGQFGPDGVTAGLIDRWMNRQTDRQSDGGMDRSKDRQIDELAERHDSRQTDKHSGPSVIKLFCK